MKQLGFELVNSQPVSCTTQGADDIGENQTAEASLPVAPITYLANFLPLPLQTSLLQEANSYQFEKPIVTIFGKQHPIPRSQIWFGDSGCEYQYSSLMIKPQPWPPVLLKVRQILESQFNIMTNGVLVNRYENGQDCMGWHSDNEPEIAANSDIVSLTLGASRTFVMRHMQTRHKHAIELSSGDLLIMHAGMQDEWQHAVPKRLKVNEPRINFTFRQMIVGFHQGDKRVSSR